MDGASTRFALLARLAASANAIAFAWHLQKENYWKKTYFQTQAISTYFMESKTLYFIRRTTIMQDVISLVQQPDGTDPCLYQYYNQLQNHRTIVFNSAVDESLLETVILPLKEFEEDDNIAPVTLVINSVGGSVLDGLVLVNIIDSYKKKLNIIAYGYVASMGAIIMCAGKDNPNVTKYCHKFTIGLFHDG